MPNARLNRMLLSLGRTSVQRPLQNTIRFELFLQLVYQQRKLVFQEKLNRHAIHPQNKRLERQRETMFLAHVYER